MARGLTPDEKNLWTRATKDVKPIGQAPVGSIQGQQFTKVATPHSRSFSPCMDLHGLTVQEAFLAVKDHIENGALLGYKRLTVISGKSGQINLELPRWVENNPLARSVESKNGGGAWEIWLKKRDT